MKILVTGSNGQLAREIIKVGSKKYNIVALKKEELDITRFNAVAGVVSEVKPAILINCAAYNDVDKAESDWEKAFLVNGIGARNLAIICEKNNVDLVHFSSDYVFSGEKREPYTIADRPSPINKYGESKLLGEEMIKAHMERFYIIRTSWVFGDGKFSFPKKVIQWSREREELKFTEDHVSVPTYTEDLARAVMDLIETGQYGLYHITNSGFCSRFRWAEYILKKINWKGWIQPARLSDFPAPAKRPTYTVMDNFPVKDIIGKLLPSWEDATERFLKVLKEM